MGYRGFPDNVAEFRARPRAGARKNGGMRIHIERVAMLVVQGIPPDGWLERPDGSTAGDLLQHLCLSAAHQRVVTVFVNETRVRPTAVLHDGDRVFLGLPMSGG